MLMGSLEIQWDKVLDILGIQEMLKDSYVKTQAYPQTHWYILKRKNKELASNLEKLPNVSPTFPPPSHHLLPSPYLQACNMCLSNEVANMELLIHL